MPISPPGTGSSIESAEESPYESPEALDVRKEERGSEAETEFGRIGSNEAASPSPPSGILNYKLILFILRISPQASKQIWASHLMAVSMFEAVAF